MIRSRTQRLAGRAIAASSALVRGGFWIVSLLAITTSAGALALPANPIAAQSTPAGAANRMQGTGEFVADAPSAAQVPTIAFSLSRTGDSPNNLRTQFDYGPQVVYGFVDYSQVNVGDRLRWVLRLRGDPPTDVNWGDIVATGATGRAVLELRRIDNQPLMPGSFDLVVGIPPEAGGLELRRNSFEIVGDGDDDDDSSEDNEDSEDDCSDDEDNGDSEDDCSDDEDNGDSDDEDNGDSDDGDSEDNEDSEDDED